jgi:hypothetical protein
MILHDIRWWCVILSNVAWMSWRLSEQRFASRTDEFGELLWIRLLLALQDWLLEAIDFIARNVGGINIFSKVWSAMLSLVSSFPHATSHIDNSCSPRRIRPLKCYCYKAIINAAYLTLSLIHRFLTPHLDLWNLNKIDNSCCWAWLIVSPRRI